MNYWILSIVFYSLIIICLIGWLVNYIRKVLLHWEYKKRVEGKFENYHTLLIAILSFDLRIARDMMELLLPVFERNYPKENESPEFTALGEKLKEVFWWSWGCFVAIISLQVLMLFVTSIFNAI